MNSSANSGAFIDLQHGTIRLLCLVMAQRLHLPLDFLVAATQSAFIGGGDISDNLLLHLGLVDWLRHCHTTAGSCFWTWQGPMTMWTGALLGVMLGTRGEGSWRGRCVCGTLQIVTMSCLKYSQNNKCEAPMRGVVTV
jgi:hypothetical protein